MNPRMSELEHEVFGQPASLQVLDLAAPLTWDISISTPMPVDIEMSIAGQHRVGARIKALEVRLFVGAFFFLRDVRGRDERPRCSAGLGVNSPAANQEER